MPLVGIIMLAVGAILGAVYILKDGQMHDLPKLISGIVSGGISTMISALFQALVWTTVGFVIADRVGAKSPKMQEWKIEDLPEIPISNKSVIPLSDCIAELIITVLFSIFTISLLSGLLPFVFIIQDGDTQIRTLFSQSFATLCIPAIIIMTLLVICKCVIMIKTRRWTPVTCGAVIISGLVNTGILLYLINRPNLFSEEFLAFLSGLNWVNLDLSPLSGTQPVPKVILIASVVIVICYVIDCGKAIYKTVRYGKKTNL